MATGEQLPAVPLEGPKLRRELRLIDVLSIVVGSIVGSGIFTTPGVVLAQAGSVGEGMVAWLVAAGISLCSALLYAELGTSIPIASGDAEFLRTAFGPSWSFSFIWTSFLVFSPGTFNIYGSSLAQYLLAGDIDHLPDFWTDIFYCIWRLIGCFSLSVGPYFGSILRVHISYADFSTQDMEGDRRITYIALASVVALTICNCAGVRVGSFVQNCLSLCKAFLVLVVLTVAAIFLTRDTSVLQANFSKPFMGSSITGFGPSMVAALWAFRGFSNIVFLTEEMKNPSKDIPRVGFGAIVLVTSGYLAVNFSYLSVLPSSDIGKSLIVAMDSTKAVLGQHAGKFTAILVALSLLGSLNASLLSHGRYLYSTARDGHYNGGWLGQVNEHNGAPIAALIAQGVWSSFLLLLSTNVVKILNYLSTASFLFTALIAVAHWKVRYQFPGLSRPFKVPLHPWLNIVVLVSSMYMVASSLSADPVPTIGSLIFTFSSFPVYHIFVKKKNVEPHPDDENGPLVS